MKKFLWQPANLTAALLAAICLPVAAEASSLSLLMAGPWAADHQTTTPPPSTSLTYPIVDTNQSSCYENVTTMSCPVSGADYYGQDAQYKGTAPSYKDNKDGTITDNRTGLMWQQNPGEKKTATEGADGASSCTDGGYTDWRLPTIKELYSLIEFSGTDASGYDGTDTSILVPFLDTTYFEFQYGDVYGDRIIDSQFLSSTAVKSGTNNSNASTFGVNFADGRIKGYENDRTSFFVRYVRGGTNYGTNNFQSNGDETVTDNATGLMWMKNDSQTGMEWKAALAYCEDLSLAGHTDWRLPNAKELQSIVDYTRTPDTDSTAAIDPTYFNSTSITNEAGETDWPYYWTSTTHGAWSGTGGWAVYIAFGRSLGYMNNSWIDVHGAGAQKSDFKTANTSLYPNGYYPDAPQHDAARVYNYVRCVRDADVSTD